MKPLQSVAMGLLIILLVAPVRGHDLLADPVGWVLVLLGVRDLPVARRRPLLALGAVAGAVSVAVWFPEVATRLADGDPALLWSANLPQLALVLLLCHELAERARAAGDTRASAWLRTLRLLAVVVAVLPPLVFGAGVAALEVPAYVAAQLLLLVLVWLGFRYAARPWATREQLSGAAGIPGAAS